MLYVNFGRDSSRLRKDEDLIEEFLFPDDGESEPENYIDLDKAWHGLHYLLTGEADGGKLPLSLAVIGGEEFGPMSAMALHDSFQPSRWHRLQRLWSQLLLNR